MARKPRRFESASRRRRHDWTTAAAAKPFSTQRRMTSTIIVHSRASEVITAPPPKSLSPRPPLLFPMPSVLVPTRVCACSVHPEHTSRDAAANRRRRQASLTAPGPSSSRTACPDPGFESPLEHPGCHPGCLSGCSTGDSNFCADPPPTSPLSSTQCLESLPILLSDLVRVHPGRPAALPTAMGWDEELRARTASVLLPRQGHSDSSFRTDPIMLRHGERSDWRT